MSSVRDNEITLEVGNRNKKGKGRRKEGSSKWE
jgi:hypothetical protein